jgi:hypothetical protein
MRSEYQIRATRQAMRNRGARELFRPSSKLSTSQTLEDPEQLPLSFETEITPVRFQSDEDHPLRDIFPEAYE